MIANHVLRWAVASLSGFLGLLTVLTIQMVASAPPAAAADYRIVEVNVCGQKCNGGTTAVADEVAFRVNALNPKPIGLALNELCVSQYNRLRELLDPSIKLNSKFVTTKLQGGTCGNFGNAVFGAAVPPAPLWKQFTSQKTANCDVNAGHECRRMHCVKYSPSFGAYAMCTTHLEPEVESVRNSQINEALITMNTQYYTSDRRVIAGDYNEVPAETIMDPWYQTWGEAHGVTDADRALCSFPPNCSTIEGGAKIDYIFGKTNLFVRPYLPYTTLEDMNNSDHNFFRGTVAW